MIHKSRGFIAAALLVAQIFVFATPSTARQTSEEKKSQDAKQGTQEKPLRLRTDEVLVDAVVLDKKSHAVSDLTADDFELYEDGVRQKITSFRFESNGVTDATNAANPAAGATRQGINLVALVFDAQTTRDGALLARRAALDYVDSNMKPNDYVAVFGIDQNLLILAPFTQEKPVLKRAIDAFTSRESKKYNAVAGEVRQALDSLVTPLSDAEKLNLADTMSPVEAIPPNEQPALSPGSRSAASNQVDPARVTKTQVLLSALKSLRTFSVYENQFLALRVVDALLAVISGQSGLQANRKTLMLFSEGVAIPATASDQFLSVISAANKAGITIYALDTAGLRVINPDQDAMLERDAQSSRRLRNKNPELVSDGSSALGKMEDTARMNSLSTLDELSEQTGGYTIKNTNDLLEGLKRIVDGLGNHYVITYHSTNEIYDGRFRRITLKLKNRSGLQLRARQGYYGLKTLDDAPVMASELPLLNSASSASPQSDFPLYAEALHFRGTPSARQVAVYLQFPMSALKFETDDKTKMFSSRFAVLMLIKNDAGVIVRKLGQEYSLHGPIAQLQETVSKPEMYSRLVLLEAGKYTIDGVARDSITGKASVVHGSFEVPAHSAESIGISSVVLSRGVNPLTEQQKKEAAHPLYLEGQAYFVPNVMQAFSIAEDKNLLVHFDVYQPKTRTGKVNISVDFLKGGSPIAKSSGELPEADPTGRIQYSTSFPLSAFPAGEYQLRVTANDGSAKASSITRFEVRP